MQEEWWQVPMSISIWKDCLRPFRSSKLSHTRSFKWYCVCSEAAVCEYDDFTGEDNSMEKMGWRAKMDLRSWSNQGKCVCACVLCVHAVSAEIQEQCGSVVTHSHGTCQAGSNVGQTPRGISYPVVSLSLCATHSLSIRSFPEARQILYQQQSWTKTYSLLKDNVKPNNHLLWEWTTSISEGIFLPCFL